MNRQEALAALAQLQEDLAQDIHLSQTRNQHLRATQRYMTVSQLISDLSSPPSE